VVQVVVAVDFLAELVDASGGGVDLAHDRSQDITRSAGAPAA
jgi:hypothetical protein